MLGYITQRRLQAALWAARGTEVLSLASSRQHCKGGIGLLVECHIHRPVVFGLILSVTVTHVHTSVCTVRTLGVLHIMALELTLEHKN